MSQLNLGGGGSGGVTSINALTGALTLVVGTAGLDFGITSGGTTLTLNLPDASSTARGVVTTGTQTFSGDKSFLGQINGKAGTSSSVGICLNGDANTGNVSTGSDEWATYAGGFLITKEYATGFAWFQPSDATKFIQNTMTGGTATFAGTSFNSWIWTSSATSSTNYQIINTSSGALGWSMSALGSANGDYLGGFNLVSDRSGANPVIQVRKFDQIILGGNSGVLTSNSVVLADRPATTITGTTTANAATSITIISGLAIQQLSQGDRIATSNAPTVFASVLTVVSNTSITVDAPLGDGVSRTISRKSGTGFVDGTAAYKGVLNDLGRLGLGLVNPQSLIHVASGAAGGELRFTNTTTGTLSTDGITYGVKTNGEGLIQQNENLQITVRNNGLDTARFTQYNSLSFTADGTTHFFDTATELNVSRDLTVTAASGFHAAISVIPQVSSDTDNTCTYYGLAMEPSLIGVNGFAEGYGSLFGVDNQTSGTSGQLAGLRLSISNSGGGTVTDSFAGLTITAENNVGSVPFIYGISATTANGATVNGPVYAGRFAAAAGGTATDLISMIATEPVDSSSGGMSGLIAAAYVDGTLAIKQSDSAATGAINSLTIITSHMHMTGNPTINGIDPVNHTAHFLIITCSAGMTITDQSGSATTASGRIITGSGLSIVVVGDGAVMIKRDITNSRWRVVSIVT